MDFLIRRLVKRTIRSFGYEIVRQSAPKPAPFPADVSAEDRVVLEAIAPFTMTSVDRQLALIQSVRYVVRNRVPGCIVECGVWRGGSAMAVALTLAQEDH